jgi:hypothetical protein
MSDMKRLLEAVDKAQFAGEKVGQKPGDQWRGSDKKTPGKKLVGEENVFKELDSHLKENAVERKLKAQLAEFKQGVAEGTLNEYRDQLWAWIQSKFPSTQWPEYVQRDFLYAKAKGLQSQKDLEDFLDEIQRDFGNCKWTLTKIPITLDIFTPKTQRMIQSREGGSSNPFQVPKDAERHAQQSQMIQQKGVSAEPIIVAKLANGYDLIEGWHRTIQHLKAFPQGYTGPAWVCTGATYKSESVEQGVAENNMPPPQQSSTQDTSQQAKVRAALEKGLQISDKNDADEVSRKTAQNDKRVQRLGSIAGASPEPVRREGGWDSRGIRAIASIEPDGTIVLARSPNYHDLASLKQLLAWGGMAGAKLITSQAFKQQQGVAEATEYGIPDSTPGHLPGGPKMTFGEFKKMWPGVILKRPSGGSLAGSVVADVEGWMNNPKSVWEPLKGVTESEKIGGKYDPEEFDAMVSRLGQKAKQGPMKTVWDPVKRVYKNVPVNQNKQAVKEYGNAQDPDDQSTTPGAAGSAQQDQEDDMGAKLGAQATNQSINALKAIEPNLNPTLAKQALAKGDIPTTMSSAETGQAKELSDLLGTALGNPQTSSQVTALLRKAAQLKGK